MKFGIFAPYRRCEQTWMALQLAARVTADGWEPRILCPGAPGTGVHRNWDRAAAGAGTMRLARWAYFCRQFAWFTVHPMAMGLTARVADPGTPQTLVFFPRVDGEAGAWPRVPSFRVLTPSVTAVARLPQTPPTIRATVWPAPVQPLAAPYPEHPSSALVVTGPEVTEGHCRWLLQVLEALVRQDRDRRVTVASLTAFSRRLKRQARALETQYGSRLRALTRTPLHDLPGLIRSHRVLCYPSTWHDAPLCVMAALAMGREAVVWDQTEASVLHDPARLLRRVGSGSWTFGPYGLQRPVFNGEAFRQAVEDVLDHPPPDEKIRQQSALGWAQIRREFDEVWAQRLSHLAA